MSETLPRCSTCIISLNVDNNLKRELYIINPILQLRSTERLNNFLNVTWPARREGTFIPLLNYSVSAGEKPCGYKGKQSRPQPTGSFSFHSRGGAGAGKSKQIVTTTCGNCYNRGSSRKVLPHHRHWDKKSTESLRIQRKDMTVTE